MPFLPPNQQLQITEGDSCLQYLLPRLYVTCTILFLYKSPTSCLAGWLLLASSVPSYRVNVQESHIVAWWPTFPKNFYHSVILLVDSLTHCNAESMSFVLFCCIIVCCLKVLGYAWLPVTSDMLSVGMDPDLFLTLALYKSLTSKLFCLPTKSQTRNSS